MKFKNIPQVTTDHFSYDAARGIFSAFESDLRCVLTGPALIYDDACDVGFYLVSHRTGQKVLFVESDIGLNSYGDITHWEYSAHCPNENPERLFSLKLVIWND